MKHVLMPVVAKRKKDRITKLALARKWRSMGYTYQEIADGLGVCVMTAWHWTHHVPKKEAKQ